MKKEQVPAPKWWKYKKEFEQEISELDKEMTGSLRKDLVGKTIRDVKCYHFLSGAENHIRLTTDEEIVVIGANDLAVWIDSLKKLQQRIRDQEEFFKEKPKKKILSEG